ncbi:MAG: AAA family ATPase [Alphaproteobacteria bacterium]|nr:AAA family ATPase [Alphaproteobacteria bacterium]
MPTPFSFSISTPSSAQEFKLESGTSLFFVGANGSGKTRLAVQIENVLELKAHRISAHRALTMNPSIAKINEEEAIMGLRTGHANKSANLGNRIGSRQGGKPAVFLLNDYNLLLQVLFAEQANKALEVYDRNQIGDTSIAEKTNFRKLISIWESLLPDRKLHVTGDDITVSANGNTNSYKAEDMSDGERSIFYLIGQTLCAERNSVLIFDEPELHIHRAIMSKLWDMLEAARPDCAFIFISHDLEFVASRIGQKYVIRDYDPSGKWTIEKVPDETDFSEEITTQILGSRRPILFVEGEGSSLDFAIYRNCYPQWTVIPSSSCEDVIHSVTTMRNNESLTRVKCAGIVDADDRSKEEISYLKNKGIKVLPVSEIENLFLLPNIAKAIGEHEGHSGESLETKLQEMNTAIIDHIQKGNNIEINIARYCRRRIDRTLKKIDLRDADTVEEIASKYLEETAALDIKAIADVKITTIKQYISKQDIPALMELYDNKALVNIVANHMRKNKTKDFESWIIRILGNNTVPTITSAFKKALPVIEAL